MNKPIQTILYIFLALMILAVASVIISDGSHILADLGTYIMGLFGRARLNPYDSRGFASFFQLMAIAVFVGWAINRFRRMK